MDNRDEQIKKIVRYILKILIGTSDYDQYIDYSKSVSDKKITIIDSGFFDKDVYLTKKTMPVHPLEEWHDIPILFGNGNEEFVHGKIIIHADIIASAFFLMSRYEELINPHNIDVHERFVGKGSVSGKGKFIHRPVIDEYGVQLRNILRRMGIEIKEPSHAMKVYLTHDIDIPWKKWKFKDMIRTVISWIIHYRKICIWPVLQWCGIYRWNPYDTFDWMMELETRLKNQIGDNCQDIYFIIGSDKDDKYTESYIFDKKTPFLINKIINNASQIGLHISYNAGKDCTYEEIVKEKNNLEIITNAPMVKNRNHYLRAIGMESFRNLIDAGIHEDYTMGYADCAGFRLGTAQCINWIDPEKLVVTSLKLHPLTMMEGSLTGYMGLNEKEAYEYTCLLFENVKKNGGEFTMLFHNSSFNIPGANWMKSFYVNILKYISDRYGE